MSASSSPLSCWGWYLSEDHGQQLHFGGHDYFPTSSAQQGDVQHAVGPRERTSRLVKDTDYLLTVRVVQNRSSASNYGVDGRVTFFVGDTEVADLPLMRDITDCNNDLEGPLVGHAGLELAQVRFHTFVAALLSLCLSICPLSACPCDYPSHRRSQSVSFSLPLPLTHARTRTGSILSSGPQPVGNQRDHVGWRSAQGDGIGKQHSLTLCAKR